MADAQGNRMIGLVKEVKDAKQVLSQLSYTPNYLQGSSARFNRCALKRFFLGPSKLNNESNEFRNADLGC